jgi:hypothetical protein
VVGTTELSRVGMALFCIELHGEKVLGLSCVDGSGVMCNRIPNTILGLVFPFEFPYLRD